MAVSAASSLIREGLETLVLPLRVSTEWCVRSLRGRRVTPAPLSEEELTRLQEHVSRALEESRNTSVPFVGVDPCHSSVVVSDFVDHLGRPLIHPGHIVSRPGGASGSGDRATLHLNPRSPLTRALVELFVGLRSRAGRASVVRMLLSLSSWPVPGIDCAPAMVPYWGARVVGGPMRLYGQPWNERWVVTPARPPARSRARLDPGRPLEPGDERLGERWQQRDEALLAELGDSPDEPVPAEALGAKLLSYSPLLPSALTGSSPQRLAEDNRLFGLSAFFGNPMIDRTGILEGPLLTGVQDPLPTADAVSGFDRSLERVCADAATRLLERSETEDRELEVFWSGGIDSTAALVSLLNVATPRQRGRLVIRLDESAIAEYPRFHRRHIARQLREERLDGESVSGRIDSRRISVTGECGDQIFGSAKMKACFLPRRVNGHRNHFRAGLDTPWQETLLPTLEDWGLLKDPDEWLAWISPQLAASPLSIHTTFDLLWWLNFSLKWQQVVLRCLNNRWQTLEDLAPPDDPLEGIVHFFRAVEFQLWACQPENHARKFADRRDWRSYKEPLKRIIRDFTGDTAYYDRKEKIGSLARSTELPPGSPLMGIDDHYHPITWGRHSIWDRRREQRYGGALQRFVADQPLSTSARQGAME